MASKPNKKVKETPSKLELSEKVLEADKVKEADKQKGIYSAMAGLQIVRN